MPERIEQIVKEGMHRFFEKRIANLASLTIDELLKGKDLHFFKALGVENVGDLIAEMLRQHLSVSHTDIIGDAFFEAIASALDEMETLPPPDQRRYRLVAGQVFWQELTGDPEFYLKLIQLMRDYPREHRRAFEAEWNRAVNRLGRYVLTEFADADGNIDWEKLAEFNSKSPTPSEETDT
ncbi:MAG: PmeII family type II restriction endonuclease [Armatimonadota bacterium]